MNPRCPPAPAAIKATTAEVDQSEAAKEPERGASAKDQSLFLSLFFLSLFFLEISIRGPHSRQNIYVF